MAVVNRSSASSSDGANAEYGKTEYTSQTGDVPHVAADGGVEYTDHQHLHRGLKSRHITMIAIGGAIGTGLIIGTGKALARSGPGSILVSYTLTGLLVYVVMCALGEMAAWIPAGHGFAGYATRFCDPALGFALGWTYWFKYIIITPNQLTASALVIQEWKSKEEVNPGVWIAVFMVTIICINYFGVRFFGEFEFWLSSIKVVTIVALILLCFLLAVGAGPTDATGFKYYNNPGGFREYIDTGASGRFYGFWSSFVNAVFAYLGTELIGVTVGEAQNPRKTIPRAIKLTFYRILFFYCLSVFFLGMLVPYNDPKLIDANKVTGAKASASPFVVAIRNANIRHLPGILNACILLFTFSASNSDLYIASRTLYGLATQSHAPKIFAWTDKRGVPVPALALSSCFCLLAMMNVSSSSVTVFGYFVNLVSIFGLLTWVSLLVTHIYFIRARRAQGITDDQMPYVAPFGLIGSYIALFFCCLISLTKNFDVFTKGKYGNFDTKNFVTGYLGIPLYLILIFGYKFWHKTKGVHPKEADFYTGKDEIDREEAAFLAYKAAHMKENKGGAFYKTFVSWLF